MNINWFTASPGRLKPYFSMHSCRNKVGKIIRRLEGEVIQIGKILVLLLCKKKAKIDTCKKKYWKEILLAFIRGFWATWFLFKHIFYFYSWNGWIHALFWGSNFNLIEFWPEKQWFHCRRIKTMGDSETPHRYRATKKI